MKNTNYNLQEGIQTSCALYLYLICWLLAFIISITPRCAYAEIHKFAKQSSNFFAAQTYLSSTNSISLKEEHKSFERENTTNNNNSLSENILHHFLDKYISKALVALLVVFLFILGGIIAVVKNILGLKDWLSKIKMKKAVKDDNSEALRMQFEHLTISKIKSTNREEKLRAMLEAVNYDTRGIINTLLDELKNETKKRNIDHMVIDLMVESIRKCVINLKSKNKK
jgi:uncharacterized ion transporter superfamily protein YfcC